MLLLNKKLINIFKNKERNIILYISIMANTVQKRLTLNKLISYVQSISAASIAENDADSVFANQIKSNDEFKFEVLKYNDSKTINDFPEKLKKMFDPFIKTFKRFGSKSILDSSKNNKQFSNVDVSLYLSLIHI